MRRVDNRMSVVMLLALPIAGIAQNEAVKPVEDGQQALVESFAQLVFGFCSSIVSQNGTPKLEQVPPEMALRGPFPLSETGRLTRSLQERLKAKPESMIYGATTPEAVDRLESS